MKFRLALSLIALAVITRLTLNLLPQPPHNFSPIAGMGLFGAAVLNRKWLALAVPFFALFLSDLFLNNVIYRAYFPNFTFITSWWIYAAFGVVMLIGWTVLRARTTPARLIFASLAASAAFFILSNLSTWSEGVLYPKTFGGMMSCFAAGLPFLTNTILGDLFFTTVLFTAYNWISSRQAVRQVA